MHTLDFFRLRGIDRFPWCIESDFPSHPMVVVCLDVSLFPCDDRVPDLASDVDDLNKFARLDVPWRQVGDYVE